MRRATLRRPVPRQSPPLPALRGSSDGRRVTDGTASHRRSPSTLTGSVTHQNGEPQMRHLATVGFMILATLSARSAEAQVPQPISRGPAPLAVATDPALQIAALQQQVAALQAAVQALQLKTQFVTSNGVDYRLNVPGDITIRSAGGPATTSKVLISSDQAVEIRPPVTWTCGHHRPRRSGPRVAQPFVATAGPRSWARRSRSIATAPRRRLLARSRVRRRWAAAPRC